MMIGMKYYAPVWSFCLKKNGQTFKQNMRHTIGSLWTIFVIICLPYRKKKSLSDIPTNFVNWAIQEHHRLKLDMLKSNNN